ncbi:MULTISPECIES: class I SAM-dependent methyltransferase [unclassified Amycolatopsis]|uniref:class I SAM-dependent methyltransferase n=1 Tax=unclassified Amycolatopsis TaxID=2618356 RepID=UPI00099D46C0|nr:class I SAM-dependent methyltransferase [Amycolatopsis sp. La24]
MPTLPRPEPHQHRTMAESFGVDPERYDRARPRYPDELVTAVLAASPGKDLLNVGCGTGIEGRQFHARGAVVLGVEPDARMAEFARRAFPVEVAKFEDWDPAGRTFDALVSGQAWHWVDPAAGAAKAAQVLRPGGRFVAFWHVFMPPEEISLALADALRRAMPDSPFSGNYLKKPSADAYQPMLDKAADGLAATGAFGEAENWHYAWTQDYRRDEWLDLLATQGGVTVATPEQRDRILAEVGAAIDARGGHLTTNYSTAAVTAVRLAA